MSTKIWLFVYTLTLQMAFLVQFIYSHVYSFYTFTPRHFHSLNLKCIYLDTVYIIFKVVGNNMVSRTVDTGGEVNKAYDGSFTTSDPDFSIEVKAQKNGSYSPVSATYFNC